MYPSSLTVCANPNMVIWWKGEMKIANICASLFEVMQEDTLHMSMCCKHWSINWLTQIRLPPRVQIGLRCPFIVLKELCANKYSQHCTCPNFPYLQKKLFAIVKQVFQQERFFCPQLRFDISLSRKSFLLENKKVQNIIEFSSLPLVGFRAEFFAKLSD